jgi:hypothetical protein
MESINNNQKPELSVVVVVLTGGKHYLSRCLRSLTEQRDAVSTEIIVPCDESVRHLVSLSDEFPQVQFLQLKGVRFTYAELRAIGVRKSIGRIVTITEDHCTPSPDWCAQILRAHEAPHSAVGGSVEKRVPDTPLNWAFYLADYLRYMNPIPAGPAHNLTDCNVSYKRAALARIGSEWETEFHEPTVHEALRTNGDSLWLEPKIVVHQQRDLSLRTAIRDRYAFGRLFASTRFVDLSLSRRLFYSLLAMSLPIVLVGRVAGHILRKRRHVGEFVRALPHLILISTVWAAGESLGYLTGRPEEALSANRGRSNAPTQPGHEAVI